MFRIPYQNPDKAMMRNDEEQRTWLNGVHLHHDHVSSSLTSESSPLNPFSYLYGNASPSPSPFECSAPSLNRKHQHRYYSGSSSSYNVDNITDDDSTPCKYFSGMNIWDEHECAIIGAKTRGYDIVDSHSPTSPCSMAPRVPCFNIEEKTGTHFQHYYNEGNPDMKWPKGYTFSTPMEKQGNTPCYSQFQLQNPSYPCDAFLCSQSQTQKQPLDVKSPFIFSPNMQPNLALTRERERARVTANSEISQCISPMRTGGDPVAFKCDNSFILQGEDVKYCVGNPCMCNNLWGCKKNPHNEIGIISHVPVSQEKHRNVTLASDIPQPLLLKFYSLAESQGFIYHLAMDQNGCRFLQRIVDEGTSEIMRVIFNKVLDNVVELMVHPFGNYLVQKLLDVCREDQRLQIVIMLTKEPWQLVRTSLNAHGTRVVQKLIETLNTKKQASLLRSAIQPGFLDLIKDLNGNHVIQRCLQCLSCQDNEFIFDAAAKFCVDIATHRHGCCVLQRCIDYSTGKYRDKLVTEICRHGLLLALDPFGNYVVTHIIEMKVPNFSAKLISKFKGNHVNLSMQKFSSHVVESCLKHVGESRSRIVRELLSAPHFEQLLQDPYANYVVQCALEVTKGSLHASLVEAVRPHKILRSSPYCKRIFSRGVLQK